MKSAEESLEEIMESLKAHIKFPTASESRKESLKAPHIVNSIDMINDGRKKAIQLGRRSFEFNIGYFDGNRSAIIKYLIELGYQVKDISFGASRESYEISF